MINMIVATSKNRVIGINNSLPWHLKEDLKYFKEKTSGHAILMGRKTFESIGKPLPNRINIVLTRDINFSAESVIVIHSIEDAIALFPQYPDVFIIGGGQIYAELLPLVDNLFVTIVDIELNGDTFFPEYTHIFTQVTHSPKHYDENSNLSFEFTHWIKKI